MEFAQDIVAKIAKELLYLTSEPTPTIRIHPCFLSSTPLQSLYLDRSDRHALGLTADGSHQPSLHLYDFPRLSADFQFFVTEFNASIFHFLIDSERAGEFYVPQGDLRRELQMLFPFQEPTKYSFIKRQYHVSHSMSL